MDTEPIQNQFKNNFPTKLSIFHELCKRSRKNPLVGGRENNIRSMEDLPNSFFGQYYRYFSSFGGQKGVPPLWKKIFFAYLHELAHVKKNKKVEKLKKFCPDPPPSCGENSLLFFFRMNPSLNISNSTWKTTKNMAKYYENCGFWIRKVHTFKKVWGGYFFLPLSWTPGGVQQVEVAEVDSGRPKWWTITD